ncbi:MAG: hypothetical protein AB7V13_20215, partial [Pseudorhodoplanes sp.]
MLAHLSDVKLFDVGIGAQRDFAQRAFVDLGDARRAHRPRQLAQFGRLRLHTGALYLIETDLDGRPILFLFALVDRNVVHPHPILFGLLRRVGKSHGIAIEFDLAFAARRGVAHRGFRGSRGIARKRGLFMVVHGNEVSAVGGLGRTCGISGFAIRIA